MTVSAWQWTAEAVAALAVLKPSDAASPGSADGESGAGLGEAEAEACGGGMLESRVDRAARATRAVRRLSVGTPPLPGRPLPTLAPSTP